MATAAAPKSPGYSIAEFADILNVGPSTVRRMIARGDLKAYRYGPRIIRIPADELQRIARPVTPLADLRASGEAA
ncbi:helix-turn-helix domain-containing protein [Micrococcus luteus]|uniref:helix-turn-helix domain-containing protein n=2 Tax=Bacteria TaxID=2 RepID=UPI0007652846|nr:helix-turn-helix domain-containing protein [Micrococcus luteus]MCV7546225.1 helix-turn-helix domain-containing protein [Micrococcus luteus]MCV7552781.1 helix-turn-helix domain-containing protein [Micrococcus luteus]MCV7751259.1 helix-turn-helix domain-containing protein [Micrococcus luteus]CVN88463.1 DNA binding domain%2C excisionase family [Streptococcus pneumoniae]